MIHSLILKMHLFLLEPKVRWSQSSTGELQFILYLFSNSGIRASIPTSQRKLSGKHQAVKYFHLFQQSQLILLLLGKGGSPRWSGDPHAGLYNYGPWARCPSPTASLTTQEDGTQRVHFTLGKPRKVFLRQHFGCKQKAWWVQPPGKCDGATWT